MSLPRRNRYPQNHYFDPRRNYDSIIRFPRLSDALSVHAVDLYLVAYRAEGSVRLLQVTFAQTLVGAPSGSARTRADGACARAHLHYEWA